MIIRLFVLGATSTATRTFFLVGRRRAHRPHIKRQSSLGASSGFGISLPSNQSLIPPLGATARLLIARLILNPNSSSFESVRAVRALQFTIPVEWPYESSDRISVICIDSFSVHSCAKRSFHF